MTPRARRALALAAGLGLVGGASALVLNAFSSNMVFFFSPTQVARQEAPQGRSFRVGGLVENGSLQRSDRRTDVLQSRFGPGEQQVQFGVSRIGRDSLLRGFGCHFVITR